MLSIFRKPEPDLHHEIRAGVARGGGFEARGWLLRAEVAAASTEEGRGGESGESACEVRHGADRVSARRAAERRVAARGPAGRGA